jgi:hypothetical protein
MKNFNFAEWLLSKPNPYDLSNEDEDLVMDFYVEYIKWRDK